MSTVQYNLQFDKLCDNLKLGKMIHEPISLSGGLLHRMYAIKTKTGRYAVKALNPQIMLRPVAMKNYIESEQIVNVVANTISALPAKEFNGSFIHEIDNQFYLLFDWVEGKSLKPNEITKAHCEKIGSILANIHMTDFSDLAIVNDWSHNEHLSDWNSYLKKGQETKAVWVNLLLETIDMLYNWNAQANKSAKQLASNRVISHRDLDPKNVMWNQDNPIIIDWESAGYVNPMYELIETAIYWSESQSGKIDKERFLTFLNGYKKSNGILQTNWRIVLENGFLGKLAWLEYNLRRSLWLECTDEEEQMMGTAQVTGTINAIRRYADIIDELENWLISV